MCTIELKRTIAIVHERQLAPQRGLMALLATRLLFLAELAAMHVGVAIDTTKSERMITLETGRTILRDTKSQRRGRENGRGVGLLLRMAFSACDF